MSNNNSNKYILFSAGDSDVGIGVCGWLLTAFSWLIVIVTLPFSLCVCFKVSLSLFKMENTGIGLWKIFHEVLLNPLNAV